MLDRDRAETSNTFHLQGLSQRCLSTGAFLVRRNIPELLAHKRYRCPRLSSKELGVSRLLAVPRPLPQRDSGVSRHTQTWPLVRRPPLPVSAKCENKRRGFVLSPEERTSSWGAGSHAGTPHAWTVRRPGRVATPAGAGQRGQCPVTGTVPPARSYPTPRFQMHGRKRKCHWREHVTPRDPAPSSVGSKETQGTS